MRLSTNISMGTKKSQSNSLSVSADPLIFTLLNCLEGHIKIKLTFILRYFMVKKSELTLFVHCREFFKSCIMDDFYFDPCKFYP